MTRSDLARGSAMLAGASLGFGTALAKVWVLRGLRLLGGTRTAVLMQPSARSRVAARPE